METANQYGINYGNILAQQSALKTAQQQQQLNAMNIKEASDKIDENDAAKAQNKLFLANDPTAKPTSIEQSIQWAQYNTALNKAQLEKNGKKLLSIRDISDPTQQQEALTGAIASLTPDQQKIVYSKYGTTPDQWQHNLPQMLNDTMTDYNDLSHYQAQQDLKAKSDLENQNKLSQIDKEYGYKGDIQDSKNENALTISNGKISSDEKIAAGKNSTDLQTSKIRSSGTGRLTDADKNVQAIMDANPDLSSDQARMILINRARTTNINDPIYGNKTITSSNSFTNNTQPQQPKKLKTLPPISNYMH